MGEKFTITVTLGEAAKAIDYNASERIFTVKNPIDGTYYIDVRLFDKFYVNSLYGMIISIDCAPNLDNEIPNYEYIFQQSPPSPRIDYISTLGDVIIKFNATMDVDTALNSIQTTRRLSKIRNLQQV